MSARADRSALPTRQAGHLAIAILLVGLMLSAAATQAAVRVVDRGPGFVRLACPIGSTDQGQRALVGIPLVGSPSLRILETPASAQMAVRLGEVGFFRDQRIVELLIPPGSGVGEAESVSDSVVVEVSFEPNSTGQALAARGAFYEELMYSGSIANYDQARSWRRGQHVAKRAGRSQIPRPEGMFFKVTVQEEGIYRLTGAQLVTAGAPTGIPVASLALYNGGGRPLAESGGAPSGLNPVSFVLEDGGDGLLGTDDYILFYGQGTDRWITEGDAAGQFLSNPFTAANVYWLALDADTTTVSMPLDGSIDDSSTIRTTYVAREHHEEQRAPLFIAPGSIPSGKQWYWELLQQGEARTLDVSHPDAASSVATLRTGFTTHAIADATVQILWDGATVTIQPLQRDLVTVTQDRIEIDGEDGQLTIRGRSDSAAFFDWYEVEYERFLTAVDGELLFDGVQTGEAAYALTGFERPPRVFDISAAGLTQIVGATHDASLGRFSFAAPILSPPRRYAVVADSAFKTPTGVELRQLGELTGSGGADYIVITHTDFLSAAQDLAHWRATDDRFAPAPVTRVVDVEQIYDDFSGGLFDPTAIRDFLRHAHDQWAPAPSFVVLFGDGTYDYRNHSGTSPGNWMPPYEDGESTYDEWYTHVSGNDALPDMAIGRLSVQTSDEARTVVDKLINYDRDPEFGAWQGRILLVSDDTFNADEPHLVETMFTQDSEDLAARFLPQELDLEKLYLVEFPFEGRFKPKARDAFVRRFNEGAVLLTWVGHGNSRVFAHEHVFVLPTDLQAIDNGGRQPFVFAAASQMGVFDDPDLDSMPEALIKWPHGGAIGMIAATRIGFHNSNIALARSFHAGMFTSGRRFVPVGMALLEAKLATDTFRENERRYTLFGDPLMRLSMPTLGIALQTADTLRALGVERLEGEIIGEDGALLQGFNGEARVQVFDSVVGRRETLQGEVLEYDQPVATLFRGIFPVVDGRFAGEFPVPKDITYRGTRGRISVYAAAEQGAAFGSRGGLIMSGTAADAQPDFAGPKISIGFSGQAFLSGDFVSPKVRLQATIEDPSGINIAGDVGHEIMLTVDGERTDVTSLFHTGEDYRVGGVMIDLPVLEDGPHEIILEAWDTHNNWSESRVTAVVSPGQRIDDAVFFPNPTSDTGHFTFSLSAPATVRIRIYTVSGRVVDEIKAHGLRGHNQILWAPTLSLAGGSYLYRITTHG
ncbi:MAG: type IX secretion system sortase PorU, partial [Gemmatimonadetes bacterium]|nr:type IX secretion system sortase PorU [Gemmatimonadota bacterium]